MNTMIYGLDLAKRAFQRYWIEPEIGEVCNRKFSRGTLIEFPASSRSGTIAMKACGSAHWWAQKLNTLGHDAILPHARFIRPFVQNNKTDAADARAIWTAAQQPEMRTVAVKTEEQQAVLALHLVRSALVKSRTAQVNQLRGLLYEFGIMLRGGRLAELQQIRERMADLEDRIPTMLFDAIKEQLDRICRLDDEVSQLEKRMAAWKKQDESCKAVAVIPGIGLLTATALVATVGDAKSFRSGREFAAFVGLVPRQSGAGGKIRLGAISKRGDPYLRTLLINGARAVLWEAKQKSAWIESLAQRRPPNVAVVALANKIARTAWAITAHERRYERSYGAAGT